MWTPKHCLAFSSVLLATVAVAQGLSCSGPADVVIAVPSSPTIIPREEFQLFEKFLIDIISYFDVDPDNVNVGLISYGSQAVLISDLSPVYDHADLNARVTLLSERDRYAKVVNGIPNVPAALRAMKSVLFQEPSRLNLSQPFKTPIKVPSRQSDVQKIGLIFTYGSKDASADTSVGVADAVDHAAEELLSRGVGMFAVSLNGTLPGFPDITDDHCRLFSLGKMTENGLRTLRPFLASAVCFNVTGVSVPDASNDCFPGVGSVPPPPVPTAPACPSSNAFIEDPTNYAYYYQCHPFFSPIRSRCAGGTLFSDVINNCDHVGFTPKFIKYSCPDADGIFRVESQCSSFATCSGSRPHVMSCPAGTVFDEDNDRCDYDDGTIC